MSELVERWRLRCSEWLDKEQAAQLLRETKNDVFAEIASKSDGSTNAERERNARISPQWIKHRNAMLEAEHEARKARMRMKYEEMQFEAWRTAQANDRRERARY